MEFGVEWKDLFGLFTLTDSHGHQIPVELSEIDEDSWTCIPKQPLARQQFPLKLACALDVRY